MPDGLDALQARRSRRATAARRAGLPPSRNQPATSPVAVPIPAEDTLAGDRAGAPPAAAGPAAVPGSEETPSSATAEADRLVKTTIHFGAAEDRFLDEVSYAGKTAHPKVDASRSAVARLALRRLTEQMTPEEIVTELRRRTPTTTGTGRKRLS